ncbi:hypothetical protein GCM10025878_18780 [Leuconostoc gasicomitatum]|uniref:DUF1934 domain-containing protein n=2 Tax=Leuconostoc TaxID=1243 RepID=A0AAN2QX25_9LACO|nr:MULTISPECIES: DUF1934 domain-containing protein [Leuconostoc]MBZ5943370.1 DUF1934 domain-containing protein [Leuconostoc gasicomitatum]MBZ5946612.1 DUF1934 domain-containing protein [Leuconostoc gasicomitatum]MBZ5948794.1 DUF1934 domain-containing protein [Leuconostoc gasicomitatum]MBZ5950735.1 DUF1934 domain-containing protein [Leuconostoc gasicomitatum]MBZ5956298.1 DUF1934 domain-containing protein [Leuconostoc gasicomitatum]
MANDNVNIYLKTTINQAGESEVFEFDTTGEVLIKNGEFFLRYVEVIAGQNQTKVLFKIAGERARLNRSGDVLTKLSFSKGQRLPAHYQTPAGQMQLETYTTALSSQLDVIQLSGLANISYDLYANDAIIGQYDILLQFTQKSSKLN